MAGVAWLRLAKGLRCPDRACRLSSIVAEVPQFASLCSTLVLGMKCRDVQSLESGDHQELAVRARYVGDLHPDVTEALQVFAKFANS